MDNDKAFYRNRLMGEEIGVLFFIGLRKATQHGKVESESLTVDRHEIPAKGAECWNCFVFRVADDKVCIDEFLKRVGAAGVCDYVQRVPRAVASSVGMTLFRPIEVESNWMFANKYAADILKCDEAGMFSFTKISRAGYKFVRSLMEG